MGTLFGGGGGGTTNKQPQAGSSGISIYQPQNQPGLDQAYQNLISPMYNQALGGLQAFGNVSPTQALYPGYSNIAGSIASLNPGAGGSYGPYGDTAVNSALSAYQNYANIAPTIQGYGSGLGGAASTMMANLPGYFTSDAINAVTNRIANNPYDAAALNAALGAGQTATSTAGAVSPGINQLTQAAGGLTGQGQSIMDQMLGYTGQVAGGGQTLMGAAPGLSNQAQATTGQLSSMMPLGQGLAAAGGATAGGIAGTTPSLNQNVGGSLAQQQLAASGALGRAAGDFNQLDPAAQSMFGAGQSLLQTGFDPQSALYNRTAQQLLDQSGAVNAMSGVGATPYGAGVTGNTMENFNIDWQNQQLQRQATAAQAAGAANQAGAGLQQAGLANLGTASGLAGAAAGTGLGLNQAQVGNLAAALNAQAAGATSGAGITESLANQQLQNTLAQGNILGGLTSGGAGLYGTAGGLAGNALGANIAGNQAAGGLYGTGLNLGSGLTQLQAQAGALPQSEYQQQQQQQLNALQQQAGLAQAGAQTLGGLGQTLGQAGTLQQNPLQTLAQMGQQPYSSSVQQAQNALSALAQQNQFGMSQYALPQQMAQDLQSYLQMGQAASVYGGGLSQLSNQQNLQALQGLGQFGSLTSPLLFGSGGLSGALGLNPATGLLGSLPGSTGFSTATDFAGGEAGAGSGLLGWIGSLFSAAPAVA